MLTFCDEQHLQAKQYFSEGTNMIRGERMLTCAVYLTAYRLVKMTSPSPYSNILSLPVSQ